MTIVELVLATVAGLAAALGVYVEFRRDRIEQDIRDRVSKLEHRMDAVEKRRPRR